MYQEIFKQGKIGNITLKNRLVMSPMGTSLAEMDGSPSEDMIAFYEARAGASTLARNKNYYKPQKCGLFYVKFYLFLCCTELYFIFICDIMRYETQL